MNPKNKYFLIAIFLVVAYLLSTAFSFRVNNDFDHTLAKRVILAEAADQGLKGMIAVGEVIRNRGEIEGFSVLDNNLKKFEKDQPKEIRKQAKQAWFLSRFTNFTKGADHFDNIKRFGVPSWAKDMAEVVTIEDMTYYKST